MKAEDVSRIRVGGFSVGITGLQAVIESMTGEYAGKPDRVIREELIKRLGKRNYIPEKVKQDYAAAFLREFKRFMGDILEAETSEDLEIKVLGLGCPRCDGLEQALMDILSELNIEGNIEHIRDIKEIGRYGVMGSPALLINGRIQSVGRVPLKSEFIKWLIEAKKEPDKKN